MDHDSASCYPPLSFLLSCVAARIVEKRMMEIKEAVALLDLKNRNSEARKERSACVVL